jgi:hypothetical protein
MNERLSDDDLKAWLTDVPPPVRSALLELQQLRASKAASDAARLESAARRAIEANGPGETTTAAVVHEIADIMVERFLAASHSAEALSLVAAYRDELASLGINGLSVERAQFIAAQIARCNAVLGATK